MKGVGDGVTEVEGVTDGVVDEESDASAGWLLRANAFLGENKQNIDLYTKWLTILRVKYGDDAQRE